MTSIQTICLSVVVAAVAGLGYAQSQRSAPLPAGPRLSFELGAESDGKPKGWGGGGEGYQLALDSKEVHGGKACGRIRYRGSSLKGFGTLTTMSPIEKYRGKRVRYTGWLRSKDIKNGWAGMWMRIDGQQEGEVLGFDNMADRPVKGTSGWTKFQIEMDVPVSARTLVFGFLLSGDGTLWGDDFQMDIVGPSRT